MLHVMLLELVIFQVYVVDFVQIRPFEESLHQKCSTLRGGLGRSAPGASGVLPVAVSGPDRFQVSRSEFEHTTNLPQELAQGFLGSTYTRENLEGPKRREGDHLTTTLGRESPKKVRTNRRRGDLS